MTKKPVFTFDSEKQSVDLHCPKAMPKASAFLWNSKMMLQMNCRGYAVSQFMQPEPAKYAHGPTLEAKTFMQPEHPYYMHHPGRFFYIRDNKTQSLCSLPYEPVRQTPDSFRFSVHTDELCWHSTVNGLEVTLSLKLADNDVLEIWDISVKNASNSDANISIFPYFTIGYMSWMNQSANFDSDLNAVIASSITPYQKVDDYFKNKHLKDKTFLLAEQPPNSWLASQTVFEGEGGLQRPDAIMENTELSCQVADYEMPAAVMQFDRMLEAGASCKLSFLFGPALDKAEIQSVRQKYFGSTGKTSNDTGSGPLALHIETEDPLFDHFVNIWLPRQVRYHGETNRLTTDPQTRNYLQDNLGMAYVDAPVARRAFVHALSQQRADGSMPDGILLMEGAELKYINQVPHADHCVWLPLCLKAYLDETGDKALLDEQIPFTDSDETASLKEHIDRAMEWLLTNRDDRGLSYIHQGDWCDPMNMVGWKGKGVSSWLSLATAFALKEWTATLNVYGTPEKVTYFTQKAEEINAAVNDHMWDGAWYARGRTDDDVPFGIAKDPEGSMFLNPQSWSILSGANETKDIDALLGEIDARLGTPYGHVMLAPAYTAMRDDVGRVTQKFPGSAENGAVYNHATIFYGYSLYMLGEADRAFNLLKDMLPSENDCTERGQLPVFIPNYYRGAYHQYPRTAGRSSQLFNTGTVSWYYRCVIEGLFGLKGENGDLLIKPNLPSKWNKCQVTRYFNGAEFTVTYKRSTDTKTMSIKLDGAVLENNRISRIEAGRKYTVVVSLPSLGGKA